MKRLCGWAVGVFLSVFLVVAVNAAPAGPQVQKGETSGKKAMKAMRDREQKVREVKKQASAMRQQALYGKSGQNQRSGK